MSRGVIPPFHLAFPVTDLEATRRFYVDLLGCSEGRSASRWIDFDFYGHQLSAHLVDESLDEPATNPVDGKAIPVRHFGAILRWEEWHRLKDSLQTQAVDFLVEPQLRFAGKPGEQATFFILDPSGNCLELKAFRNPAQVFATA